MKWFDKGIMNIGRLRQPLSHLHFVVSRVILTSRAKYTSQALALRFGGMTYDGERSKMYHVKLRDTVSWHITMVLSHASDDARERYIHPLDDNSLSLSFPQSKIKCLFRINQYHVKAIQVYQFR